MDIDEARATVADIMKKLETVSQEIGLLLNAEIMGDRYDEELREAQGTVDALAIDIGGMEPEEDA